MFEIKSATKDDLYTMVQLEEKYFGRERAEVEETFELVLEMGGNILIEYRDDTPTGMLATVPVSDLMKTRARNLPENSPFRRRIKKGYLDSYDGYDFVMSFVPSVPSSLELIRRFLELKRAVGFVYGTATRSLEFYVNQGCRIMGEVDNIHSPGEKDVVLVLEQ